MRTIKSFVARAGRISPRQQQGLDVFLKDYLIPKTSTLWSLDEIFTKKAPLIVEIGFGMGASLIAEAQKNPTCNYLGIEVHQAGLGAVAADMHDLGLHNVRLVAEDAVAVIKENIPDNTVHGIQIFFPDPWPKKRHHKRRLIQPEFVALLTKKLQPGGFIHCATDWQDYAYHMLDALQKAHDLENQSPEGGFVSRPETRPETKFEARGLRLGHEIWDLVFHKSLA